MCGIAGLVSSSEAAGEREVIVRRMVAGLRHRGPDDQGTVSDGAATFGVARLSIVDRALGHQPMRLAHSGRLALIAYNGEVYNFRPLRKELVSRGLAMHTVSDTETVLGVHLAWGPEGVRRLDGMFAYAVWDAVEQTLILTRDRLGIKPLYYVELNGGILFSSEPKALFCHPGLSRRPNPVAILEYFTHGAAFASGYTTHDRSFFEGVRALPPGHQLTWSPRGKALRRYWSPADELGPAPPGEAVAEEELAEAAREGVRAMLMGEVPVGTALSGGLDSSLITSETAAALEQPLLSASITFREDAGDADAAHAALLSRWLNERQPGCHQLVFAHLSAPRYLERLDEMIRAFDEPHWELRQLGMFQNYGKLAEHGRTVVLTGEGADELLFGYYQRFPGFKGPPLASPADFARAWRERMDWVRALLAPAFASGLVSREMQEDLIGSAVAGYLTPCWEASGSRLRAVQAWYLQTFLHWLLLVNDRCSMHHGLEGRFPFLSSRFVRLGLRLPPEWNTREEGPMREKTLLRKAARRSLPPEIWREREKAPLPVPDAVPYHLCIAEGLRRALAAARTEVWDFLDRRAVGDLLAADRKSVV